MTDRPMIVAEISKNYIDGEPVVEAFLAEHFEEVILRNHARGYRLHSWKLSRVVVHEGSIEGSITEVNETIIAVFEKAQDA